MSESPETGDEVAIPDTEFPELKNPVMQPNTPSEVVVSGGTFPNANFGPNRSTNRFEARHYTNTTVNEIHHNYYRDSGGGQEASSSGPQQPNSPMVQETSELEEGYIRISDDTVMYVKEPIRAGTNVFKGYQEHVSAGGQPKRLPVAIKRIVPSNNKHRKEVDHYVTLASHSNVVRIIQSKEHETPYARVLHIVMELCSPQNLQDYLNENRQNNTPLDFKKTLKFTKQLLKGVKHIHDNGIVHRDVKPENVLLSTDKTQLKFTDFGLGKELRQGRTSTKATVQGQGTVGYRAPETFTTDTVSKSGDIFSLGVTIFGLWSDGNHPYGANILLRDNNILTNTNHDFSSLLITGPLRDDFLDLICQMLQHDPRHRPTAGDLLKHSFIKNAAREMRSSEELPSTSGMNQQERVRRNMASLQETLPKQTGFHARHPRRQVGVEVYPNRVRLLSQGGSSSGRHQGKAAVEARPSRGTYFSREDSPIIEGNQPLGQMDYRLLDSPLPGYENSIVDKTTEITYKFPEGCLNGIHYASREFKAYIPNYYYGLDIYSRLENAFEAGAIFRLRYKRGETTGEIVWGDIPHKTNKTGGPDNKGYPDHEYEGRLIEALDAKGFWNWS